VYLRRTNDSQKGEQPYQTDLDRERQDQAGDEAKALAFKLLTNTSSDAMKMIDMQKI
jgi:hypothetical protein